MTRNQLEFLKQAAGMIGRPDYKLHVEDVAYLERRGFIQRTFEDDQPTAYATEEGREELSRLLAEPTP